jgi:hypothetical protein
VVVVAVAIWLLLLWVLGHNFENAFHEFPSFPSSELERILLTTF